MKIKKKSIKKELLGFRRLMAVSVAFQSSASVFSESNMFFERFNLNKLINEKLTTPNKLEIERTSTARKTANYCEHLDLDPAPESENKDLTPISIIALRHIINSHSDKKNALIGSHRKIAEKSSCQIFSYFANLDDTETESAFSGSKPSYRIRLDS
jgi:hypothetical protein